MKINVRYLLILSALFFWMAFTTLALPVMVLFGLFGLGTGWLLAQAKPLSRFNWPAPALRWLLWALSAIFSVLGCIGISGIFYRSWLTSAMLKSIVTKVIPNYETGLLGISVILGLGMLPFLFEVLCRTLWHLGGMVAQIRFPALWKHTVQSVTLKGSIKNMIMVILTLLLSAAIGMGLLTAVFSIPVSSIENNVAKSALTIQQEGTYPFLSQWFYSRLDNWTDSISLMEAALPGDPSPLEAAVNAFHGGITGTGTPAEALVAHYVDGQPYTDLVEYMRYWHGYLVVLKPLLCMMDYNAIRVLNGIVQLLLVALICFLMHKRGLKAYIIPLLLIYGMLMPLALACSIQFSTCFYVIVLGLIGMLLIPPEKLDRRTGFLFLTIGIATAYFDFLTYPIATFGIPVLMLLVLQSHRSLEEKLVHIVKCGIFWCIGFGGMWACKWIISYVVCDLNFSQILNIIADRTAMSGDVERTGLLRVESLNYTTFLTTPVTLIALLVAGIRLCKYQKTCPERSELYRRIFPYILVACAPVVWYAFASDHSSIHYWFTNKACAVTVLALLFAVFGVTAPKSVKS